MVWAALAGFVVGVLVRALAAGFEPDPADTRAEARRAFTGLPRRARPGGRPVIELVTAAVFALLAWRMAPAYLPALLYAAAAGTALAVIDWRTSRLPDVITLPSYPILALLLLPTGRLTDALLGGAALLVLYGVLWFVRPTAMGLGDVKLAGLIGMAAGAVGWNAWVAAALAGQLLGALYAITLLVMRKADRSAEFPFGPFMIAGALCLAW
ncbi:prepilin peptidase [Nonomuraea africana]|uniref:Leader peptidase (Prepilin peptidase)/N-methyltransferase n=1 Tax=Nonomuraea africana TaxID=46171 RepID=A0ABR9K9L0_9ACTN|nr:A24 family peptidase [Nonomuraea africana]MBE1558510.1 leader peptidase (prepilin peptidase)/N-methyltransferase [Nonomuraea africana]